MIIISIFIHANMTYKDYGKMTYNELISLKDHSLFIYNSEQMKNNFKDCFKAILESHKKNQIQFEKSKEFLSNKKQVGKLSLVKF